MLYLVQGVMLVSLFICTFAAAKVVLRWPKAINMLKKSGLRFCADDVKHPEEGLDCISF